jgi:hypothetical protein
VSSQAWHFMSRCCKARHGIPFFILFRMGAQVVLVFTQQKWRTVYFSCCAPIISAASFCWYGDVTDVLLWSDLDVTNGTWYPNLVPLMSLRPWMHRGDTIGAVLCAIAVGGRGSAITTAVCALGTGNENVNVLRFSSSCCCEMLGGSVYIVLWHASYYAAQLHTCCGVACAA